MIQSKSKIYMAAALTIFSSAALSVELPDNWHLQNEGLQINGSTFFPGCAPSHLNNNNPKPLAILKAQGARIRSTNPTKLSGSESLNHNTYQRHYQAESSGFLPPANPIEPMNIVIDGVEHYCILL